LEKARKRAKILDNNLYLIKRAVHMNLGDSIIQSFVNSFMKVKLSKSIKEHSLLNKKMDVEFLNALNDYFKQSLIDGGLPQILIKDISNITNTAGALGSKDKENIGQTLLEKNILTLNYLVSKLEKSSVLFDDKREHCFLEDDSSDNLAKHAKPSSFDAKDIASFQENIKELEDSGCLPITDGQLVRTKNSHRSMEDIILDPNPPKNIKIKLDDDSSFSIFNPSAKITKEYEIRQVLQATSGSSNQFSALNLEDQKSLKDAFEIFETNTKRADKWSPDTQRLVTGVKKLLFLYFNEDTPVYRITRDNLLEFRDLLYKIPTKLAQKSRYKDKSLSQILKLGEKDDKLSEPTIQKYMIRVIQFFNYCFDSGYIGKSITAKMNVKIDVDPSERAVLPYDVSEARKIFDIVTNIKQSGKSPSSRIEASELYYVTMIAAYSGMRIKEITQLHKEDIVLKDGIYCFNINTNDGKTTKTKNSIRFVPIHSKLIDLGLLEYVNSKKSGNIFKVSNKDFSEIFRSQIQRKFIDKDSKKTFYSFRHYFIDYLVQREVEANLIAQIVGHEKQYKILLNTYAKPINANTLKAKVEMVSYDNE